MLEIQKSFYKSFIFKNYQTPRENRPIQVKGCIQMTLETYSIALTMEKMQIKSIPRLQAWVTNTDYQHCWQRQGNQPLSHHQRAESYRMPGSTKTARTQALSIPHTRNLHGFTQKQQQETMLASSRNKLFNIVCQHYVYPCSFEKNKNQRTGQHFMCRQMNKQQSTIICLAQR